MLLIRYQCQLLLTSYRKQGLSRCLNDPKDNNIKPTPTRPRVSRIVLLSVSFNPSPYRELISIQFSYKDSFRRVLFYCPLTLTSEDILIPEVESCIHVGSPLALRFMVGISLLVDVELLLAGCPAILVNWGHILVGPL